MINKLYKDILNLDSLKPTYKVNKLFSSLVSYVLDPNNKNTLKETELEKLQEICSRAEYELEKHWAKKIIESDNPLKTLRKFPYFSNYRKLTQMEWFSLLSCTTHKTHKVVFVGGGPLPLTAIVMAQQYTDKITVLDIDETACELSSQLVRKLKLDKKIEIIKTDASKFENYKNYNAFVVAALAGANMNSKRKILQKIKKDSPKLSHILARSSWGLREILYKPLDKKLYDIFEPVIEVKPKNDVVNSFVIFNSK